MFGLPNPYVIGGVALVIAVLAGWGFVEHEWRGAAQKGEKAAIVERDLAQQDAVRWHDASDLRDLSIANLNKALSDQSAAIEVQRAQTLVAQKAAMAAQDAAARIQQEADTRIQKLRDEANTHPENVRDLGPIVLGRVNGLFEYY